MGNIEKFHENTKDARPHNNIKKFVEMQLNNGNAIDLGCGAGRDTIFLSKEQVFELFNEFEIIDFQENERDGKTGLGKIKHWHTFDIIAKKK
jgi:trans-aconitate methyltransferase